MDVDRKSTYFRLNLLAAVMLTCGTGATWAAQGDICVDDGQPGVHAGQICNGPTTTVSTVNQDLTTGTGSIITTDVTASGTVQGSTLTDGAGTTISGGNIDANSGTIDTLSGDSASFNTIDANSGTIDTLSGDSASFNTIDAASGTIDTLSGDSASFNTIDANTGTIDTLSGDSATFNTFDDGTVTLSGGTLSDGVNSISMDGANATVKLQNGGNSFSVDGTGTSMSAGNGTTTGTVAVDTATGSAGMTSSDGTTTGSVAVSETQASVTVDNGSATHGLTVGTTNTVLSGGTSSTTMTLDNSGAHLDNNLDMGGNRVTNMANGVRPMDAVNKRQLDDVESNLESAVSAVAAMASIPAPLPGHRYSIGMGTGFYDSEGAVAIGFNANLTDHLRLNSAVGFSASESTAGVGIGYSW